MTLTEFLLARIAEDERHARKLAESDRRPVLSLAVTVNHPERLLLECEAKRRIVEDLSRFILNADRAGARADHPTLLAGLELQLRYLAAVYADHDDYDESWRP